MRGLSFGRAARQCQTAAHSSKDLVLESMLRNANAEATACRERMRTLQVQKQEEQRKETRYGRCLTECQMAYSKALQALQERKELNSTLQACLATGAAESEREANEHGCIFAQEIPKLTTQAEYWNQKRMTAEDSADFADASAYNSMHSKYVRMIALAEQYSVEPKKPTQAPVELMQRCMDATLEDASVRSPLSVLFEQCGSIKPIDDALRPVEPFLSPLKVYVKKATRKAQEITESKYLDFSVNDAVYIVLYTMQFEPPEKSLYHVLNRALRDYNRDSVRPWRDYIWGLLMVLRRLPPCGEGPLYRGVCAPLSDFEKYKKGQEVVWYGFSSTSPDLETQQLFTGQAGPRVMFHLHMHSRCARNIRDFSMFPVENEIVLPPLMQFRVKGVVALGDGLNFVHLEETEPDEVLISMTP